MRMGALVYKYFDSTQPLVVPPTLIVAEEG